MYTIKSKLPVLIVIAFMLTGALVSSCKKEPDTSINNLLTGNGIWRLASMRVETLHGDTTIRRDTLNTNCGFAQSFKFTDDARCTYKYYSCINDSASSTWELTSNDYDSVFLRSPLVCKDTTKIGTIRPFSRSQVINLGRNSLILQTVIIDTFRKTPVVVLRRKITRYGFIH
ncbi:hypothetical protein [Mucilaginibacter sp. PAMB04168]|uniref:hypothetical protein n=1 Tax=Mucilaginibacter sp. PAMB04168 TaxID=3138567 RepID=UPI0031F5FAAB